MLNIRRWLMCIAAAALLLQPPVSAAKEQPGPSAQAYVLMDADTGETIAAGSPDQKLPCASTTKLMTALVVLETLPLDAAVQVTEAHVRAEGSRMYLRTGEIVSVSDLLYGLLLASGNDAALALADAAAGSADAFAAKMNEKAAALGMCSTHFTNPSGLHDPGHYSSARDLAILMASAMQNATFAQITGTREAVLTGRTVVNHNKLLHRVPGVDGGKTGFTKAAGRCLVTTAARNGRRLIAVTLNAPDDWRDHEALYAYGFSRYSACVLTLDQTALPALPLAGDAKPGIPLAAERPEVWLTAAEQKALTQTVWLPRFEYAPLPQGAVVGAVTWQYGTTMLAAAELRTAEAAESEGRVRRSAAEP